MEGDLVDIVDLANVCLGTLLLANGLSRYAANCKHDPHLATLVLNWLAAKQAWPLSAESCKVPENESTNSSSQRAPLLPLSRRGKDILEQPMAGPHRAHAPPHQASIDIVVIRPLRTTVSYSKTRGCPHKYPPGHAPRRASCWLSAQNVTGKNILHELSIANGHHHGVSRRIKIHVCQISIMRRAAQ